MEQTDQYNFSIFSPRNVHGRKNRNVILAMLVIWAVAVFGFQILLRVIEKPTPEKSLAMFESAWPDIKAGNPDENDYKSFLHSLVLVKGKNTVRHEDQELLGSAISNVTLNLIPETTDMEILSLVEDISVVRGKLEKASETEFLEIRKHIALQYKNIAELSFPFTGFDPASLEATILVRSLKKDFPQSLNDSSFETLPSIMKLYLTHNQSVLTDTIFLGFPFHYFYTAFFLLVLFVSLCIIYNILIEWRLKKAGVIE